MSHLKETGKDLDPFASGRFGELFINMKDLVKSISPELRR